MHLGNRDGKDQDPGQEAHQGVDDHQRRITQQQPHICGEAMLQNTERYKQVETDRQTDRQINRQKEREKE